MVKEVIKRKLEALLKEDLVQVIMYPNTPQIKSQTMKFYLSSSILSWGKNET